MLIYADVAELADALDLGSSISDVQVQVLSSAPKFFNEKMDKSLRHKGLSIFVFSITCNQFLYLSGVDTLIFGAVLT